MPARGERADELPQALALAGIERRGGLVEGEHRRVGDQSERDVHALAVAAGQPLHALVRALAQAGLLEHPRDRASGSATRSRRANSRRFSTTESFE